jgi:hypothetical protein
VWQVSQQAHSHSTASLCQQLLAANGSLQATEVAAWLNTAGQGLGISASASNEVRSFADQFQLDRSLVLNGVSITPPNSGFGTAAGLVAGHQRPKR